MISEVSLKVVFITHHREKSTMLIQKFANRGELTSPNWPATSNKTALVWLLLENIPIM